MDFVTLMTCCAVAEGCLAAALANSGSTEDRSGWRTWALSLGLRSGAFFLYVLPAFVPGWRLSETTQFAAVQLIFLSAAVSMRGTAEFLGIPLPRQRDFVPLVAMVVAYTFAFTVFDSPSWRIVLVSGGLAYGLGWSTQKIAARYGQGSARERWFVVGALSLWIGVLLARAANVLMLPTTATATAISVASLQPWFFIGYLMSVVTTVVGLIGLRGSEIMHRLELARTQAERRANTDELTGLMSRIAVLGHAERMFTALSASNDSMAVVMVDCDHFKTINDRHGHFFGDLALKKLGSTMRRVLPVETLAGRFGGEEFIVLLPPHLVASAAEVAEALRLAVRAIHLDSGRRQVSLSISMGVAKSHPNDESVQDVLNRADRALLQAKGKGRDQVVVG